MMSLAVLMFSLGGFILLALATHRHHRDVFGCFPSRVRTVSLRLGGALSLGLSFAAGVAASGWAAGPVLWLGAMTVAGIATALVLALARHLNLLPLTPGQPST